MKLTFTFLVVGVSMILYAFFGMEPQTLEHFSRQPDMIVGGGFMIVLGIAGLIGGEK